MRRCPVKEFVCIHIIQFSQHCSELCIISIIHMLFFSTEKIEIWGGCAASQLVSGKVGIQRSLGVEMLNINVNI